MAKRGGRGKKRGQRHLRVVGGTARESRGTSRASQPDSGKERARGAEPASAYEDQPLIQATRAALRSPEPLDLLMHASTLVVALDRHLDARTDPPSGPDDDGDGAYTATGTASPAFPAEEELLESFIGVNCAETTALLILLRTFRPDLAGAIDPALASRRQPMPTWLRHIDEVEIEPRAVRMSDRLGDGENYVISARLAGGHDLSIVMYVDHNMGTIVKDAFPMPYGMEEFLGFSSDQEDFAEIQISDIDLPTVRAVLSDALDTGDYLDIYPELDSETWPLCRPLLDWLLSKLPAGGAVPRSREWSGRELLQLQSRFFASEYGRGLAEGTGPGLLRGIVEFSMQMDTGDPLRWSPVNVEVLLTQWIPTTYLGAPGEVAALPNLLRAFVRFAHAEREIPPELTLETLSSIDRFEPDFQSMMLDDERQGRVLEAISAFMDSPEMRLGELAIEVGGPEALESLDAEPLPDEALDLSMVDDDIRPVVETISGLCDGFADENLDVEFRTGMRRLLRAVAEKKPAVFRRKAKPEGRAAAAAWLVCSANDTVGSYGPMRAKDLMAWFGLKGSASQTARVYREVLWQDTDGIDPWMVPSHILGSPDYLTSTYRERLIAHRDSLGV